MISPTVEPETNLSIAWAKTFLNLMEPGGDTRHPALVIVNGLENREPPESLEIRDRLDAELRHRGKNTCATVAGTIFPYSMWNQFAEDDAESLFRRYDKAWVGIRKCRDNSLGVYFRRLTSYQPKGVQGIPVNQLKFIVETYKQKNNHRKSALQASIFDPTRDHTHGQRKGFPCMQQVSFTPLEGGKLSITGFYATQYQFEKAYGNYIGLYWLGRFMANQLGLKLSQLVCIASVLRRGDPTKTELEPLANDLRRLVAIEMAKK